MTKRKITINETAVIAVTVLILGSILFAIKGPFVGTQKLQEEIEPSVQYEEPKQDPLYLQASWRKEYERAVDEYVNTNTTVKDTLVSDILKKLQPYEVKPKMIGVFTPFSKKPEKASFKTMGYEFDFENVANYSEGSGGAIVNIKKDGEVVLKRELGMLMNVAYVESSPTSYFVIETFTGGSHCCFEVLPIIITEKTVSFSEEGESELGDLSIINNKNTNNPRLFLKNDGLYFMFYDNRFAYFYTDFSNSEGMFLPVVYNINKKTGVIRSATSEFTAEYKKMVSTLDIAMSKIRKYDKEKIAMVFKNYESVEYAQPPVVLRIFAMSKITDNIDEALVKFKEDLSFFLGNDTKKVIEMAGGVYNQL